MLLDSHLLLILAANFAAATLAGALGMGGGVLVTAALSTILPITIVVPLQNAMMLFSGASRIWLFRKSITWHIIWPFTVGLGLGSIAGAAVYVQIPRHWLELLVALSMLAMLLSPENFILKLSKSPILRVIIGTLHGFLATLTASGGLLQGLFARMPLSKEARNGTIAVLLTLSNTFKFFAYMAVGISLSPYWLLILLAIPIGYAGTWVGRHVLDAYISESLARHIFQAIVLFSACNLLYQWATTTFGNPLSWV